VNEGPASAVLVILFDRATVNAALARTTWTLAGIVLALLLLAGIAATVVARGITRPLGKLERGMVQLAHGDLSAQPEGTDRTDEIGAMARAVGVFHDAQVQNRALAREAEAAAAKEAARARTEVRRLADAAGQLGTAAGSAASGGREASEAAGDSNQAVQSVAAAAAAEELAVSINEITRQIDDSAVSERRAVAEAEGAGQALRASLDAACARLERPRAEADTALTDRLLGPDRCRGTAQALQVLAWSRHAGRLAMPPDITTPQAAIHVSLNASIALLMRCPATSRGTGAPDRRVPSTSIAASSQPTNRVGMWWRPVAEFSGRKAKQNGAPSPFQESFTVVGPARTVSA
jgi:HAMP domain-containing protein